MPWPNVYVEIDADYFEQTLGGWSKWDALLVEQVHDALRKARDVDAATWGLEVRRVGGRRLPAFVYFNIDFLDATPAIEAEATVRATLEGFKMEPHTLRLGSND